MSYTTEVKFIQGLNREIVFHIGKTAVGNFDIIDLAKENDLWFHLNNESSAHVIAIIPDGIDRKNMKYVVKHGAIVLKQHSNCKSPKQLVGVIYSHVKNVNKTDIIGRVIIQKSKIIHV